MEKFVIAKDFVKTVSRFNLVGRTLELKIKSISEGQEPVSWVRDAINQRSLSYLYGELICAEGLSSADQVAFSFCSKDDKKGNGLH
ncbi:hypothetical protein NQ315_014402 [Exocentrus adspersus]|uniref:Uncharacterized protein n=1 Tax=Exocentrus adspersus TaxID=1586481 RepID=A0AAV8VF34_9CUCU|nr:hypothetical protein NQ315_014402 [Exocentrus adspersus]